MANEIPISVVDRKIKVGRHVPATMTNIGKDYLSISLDNEWSSTNHRLRVTLYSDAPYVSVQNWWDGKSAIEIPQEITSCPAFKVTVALLSEDGYERLVTQSMDEPIENPRNGHDEGSEPGVRTMDIIARIDALAADLEQKRDTDYWRGEPGNDADIAGAEAAKNAANKAAEDAIATAARADNAAINANNSAIKADEAATNADTATTNANAAAANASEKASLAASKAVEAESAATLANKAADNANETANQIKQRADSGEFNGADGYSPTANVTKNGGTATITVTDKNGTTTATVSDGAPGKDGSDATATDVRINGTSITADGVANILTSYPSGKYELIESYTVEEDVQSVIRKHSLDACMILFTPSDETNRNYGFIVANNASDAWNDKSLFTQQIELGSAHRAHVFVTRNNLFWTSFFAMTSKNAGYSNYISLYSTHALVERVPSIEHIEIYSFNSVVKAGSTIEIYGIRHTGV